MSISYLSDYLVKFLFIHSKTRLFIEIAGKNDIDAKKLSAAKEIYTIHIQSKLGLGFIASYLPWTKAFQARKELFFSVLEMHKSIQNMGYEPSMKELISLTPVYFLRSFPKLLKVIYKDSRISRLKGDNFLSLVSYLPLISDVIHKDGSLKPHWAKNIVHSLLNPFRLVSSALKFMHHLNDAVLELGASNEGTPSFFRQFFKIIPMLAFSPLRFTVTVMEASFDVVLEWMDTVFLDPLRFFSDVVEQLIFAHNLEMIYEPTAVFEYVEEKKQAKSKEQEESQYNVKSSEGYTFKSGDYTLKLVTEEEKFQFKTLRAGYDPTLFHSNKESQTSLDIVLVNESISNVSSRSSL